MIAALALLAAFAAPCGTRPVNSGRPPEPYIYFGRDHERVDEAQFLDAPGIRGALLTFSWRELEPSRDVYDFAPIRVQLTKLEQHGKRLFLQLQDVSFGERVPVPAYLLEDSTFHGGAARKFEGALNGRPRFDGWVARRWDAAVHARYARLFAALAREFDGKIEGVVLPETAIGFDDSSTYPAGFTASGYTTGVKQIISEARRAFTRSCVIVYANFMPGDSTSGSAVANLRAVHTHAATVGAGVGGPDLLPHRPFQQANSLPLIANRARDVVAGMAVQDGNLADRNRQNGQPVTVPELHRYATEVLRLDYLFWGIEEPYYTAAVLPFLRRGAP